MIKFLIIMMGVVGALTIMIPIFADDDHCFSCTRDLPEDGICRECLKDREIDFPEEPIEDEKGTKKGGKDPLVRHFKGYHEVATHSCNSDRFFDYENNGIPINFCYEIIGEIFVIDFGNGITSGYNMLQFYNLAEINPVNYLLMNPDICDYYKCYLWKEYFERNWVADEHELKEYHMSIESYEIYEDGKKHENGRYVYCEITTESGDIFHCVQPTYWSYN